MSPASSYNSQIDAQNTKYKVFAFNEALTLSPRMATLSAGSVRKCCLPRLVSAATSSTTSSSLATKGSRWTDMVRHSSHVRVSAILTYTDMSLSCLVSGHSWQSSVSMFSGGAMRDRRPHSTAGRSNCRYLQNLPGSHRRPAVAPPHEASPDMSGRRPCRTHSPRQTDRSRDVLTKFSAFPELDKATQLNLEKR